MKKQLSQTLKIPEGVTCTYENKIIKCKKDQVELEKHIHVPTLELKISDKEVIIECKKGNKLDYKKMMTFNAHIKNIFHGLAEKFVYKLEACNVHFPMALKIEGDKLTINNFLGEKVPRHATILPNVEVKIQGQQITVESHDKESAGQTAANLEQATKINNRDRRIFQDGIFITAKPTRAREEKPKQEEGAQNE